MQRDESLAVGQDLVVVLHDGVGWEATVFLRQAHRSARRMKSQTDLARGPDLGRDEIAGTARVNIEVIGARRAAAERELRETDPGRHVGRFLVERGPARIESGQPLEQRAVHRGPETAREVLEDVMVRVDESRCHEAAAGIEQATGHRRRVRGTADGTHQAVGDRHPTAFDLAALVVYRRDELRPAHQQIAAVRSIEAAGLRRMRSCHHDDGRRSAAGWSSCTGIVHTPVIRRQQPISTDC